MLSALVANLMTLVFVPQRPTASTFLACQMSGLFVTLVAALLLCRRLFGGWLAAPAYYRDPLGHLLRFGGWQIVAQGGGLVSGQVDRYLLGALLPTEFVGFYAIAQRLEEAVYIGILKVGEILFPFFSVLQEETIERKADLLFRSSWVLNLLAATALGGFIPIAGPLLRLWTNAEVAVQAEQVLVVLLIAGILGCSANVFAFYLLGTGESRSNALIAIVTAIVTLTTSALALPYFGWQAAGWSACAGMVAQVITVALLLRRAFDNTGVWLRVSHLVVAPLFAGVVTALLLRYMGNETVDYLVAHWWGLAALYCAGATVILVVVVVLSQMGPYRDTCRRDLQSIALRFSPLRAS